MPEHVILNASFNPAVKRYWLVSFLLFSTLTIVGIPLLIITIPLFLLLSSRILNAMSATITERKLVVKRGIWHKEEKSIPLEKITDVAMIQGPLMRVFDIHRLTFETAGQSAQGALVSLIGIDEAERFRETILSQKDKMNTLASSNRENKSTEDSEMAELLSSVKRIEGLLEEMLRGKM
jgi:putative membrane protein